MVIDKQHQNFCIYVYLQCFQSCSLEKSRFINFQVQSFEDINEIFPAHWEQTLNWHTNYNFNTPNSPFRQQLQTAKYGDSLSIWVISSWQLQNIFLRKVVIWLSGPHLGFYVTNEVNCQIEQPNLQIGSYGMFHDVKSVLPVSMWKYFLLSDWL